MTLQLAEGQSDEERQRETENDFQDTPTAEIGPRKQVDQLTGPELKEIVREAGIVGMGGAAFPTHVKLSASKPIDAVIINACECEPFLTCDHRLLVESTTALVEGARLICKVVDAPRV